MYTVISSAMSEWFLMALLFFNGFISYVVARFARHCRLRTPCLVCSSLDHILCSQKKKPGFFRSLICDVHKLEISSLAYCHAHRRLADVREMCEACVLSFAAEKKLDMGSYQSLVRKMETSSGVEDPPARKLPEILDKGGPKVKPFGEDVQVPKLNGQALDFLRKKHCSCCHRRFRMKSHAHRLLQTTSVAAEIAEKKGVILGCVEPAKNENLGSHVGYRELKLCSDSEAEIVPPPEDEKIASADLALEKLIHPSLVEPEPGGAVEKQVCEIKPASRRSEACCNSTPPESYELRLTSVEIGHGPCVQETPKGFVTSVTHLKPLNIRNDPTSLGPTNMDLSDAYKLAIASRGIEPTPSPRDPYRPQEDLRLLLFQLSSARGLELPANEVTPSPRICRICEEARPSDRSGPTGLQSVTKRFSLERNESGFSSLDESVFSEIEGESTVDRLKRLIEFERKSLILLYKELEEERSASAIAANQAMAMITRLQEEKAAMQMEALQYQRMMEEQAEYDQEVLQRSNDLLAQKEREILELEVEIDAYRKRLVDEDRDGAGWEEEKAAARKIYAGFDDEKVYISKCLKKLEKKLRLYSTKGLLAARSDSEEDGKSSIPLENGHAGTRKDLLPAKNKSKESKSAVAENGKDKDIVATVNMISQLNARLEALEVDKNFLEHTVNVLRNRNEGLQFIQEIASHLQDLRKAMARKEKVGT